MNYDFAEWRIEVGLDPKSEIPSEDEDQLLDDLVGAKDILSAIENYFESFYLIKVRSASTSDQAIGRGKL